VFLLLSSPTDSDFSTSGVAFRFFNTFCLHNLGSLSFTLTSEIETLDEADLDSEADGGATSLYLKIILLIY
jgi:hypothetical protein